MIAGRVTQNVRRSDSFSFQQLAAAWFAVPSLMMPVNIWSRRVSPSRLYRVQWGAMQKLTDHSPLRYRRILLSHLLNARSA